MSLVWRVFPCTDGAGAVPNPVLHSHRFLYGKQPPFFSDGKNADYDPTNDAVIPQSDHPEQSELDRLVISLLASAAILCTEVSLH
jgi:hypothetical protein